MDPINELGSFHWQIDLTQRTFFPATRSEFHRHTSFEVVSRSPVVFVLP